MSNTCAHWARCQRMFEATVPCVVQTDDIDDEIAQTFLEFRPIDYYVVFVCEYKALRKIRLCPFAQQIRCLTSHDYL